VLSPSGSMIQVWIRLCSQLSIEPDKLVWQWTIDSQYTSKSCYNTLFEGALVSSSWRLNWKSRAPPRVKFFIWLDVGPRSGLHVRGFHTPRAACCAISWRRR
jgi:hypothetical protein